MYFLCSSTRKKNEKKNLLKKCSINGFWLLPNYIVKKKIVLQPCNCIARERARKIVLQLYCKIRECSGLNCISIGKIILQLKRLGGLELYCNIEVCRKKNCIAIHLCVL